MYTTCVCGIGQTYINRKSMQSPHHSDESSRYRPLTHSHTHGYTSVSADAANYLHEANHSGTAISGTRVPWLSQARIVKIEHGIFARILASRPDCHLDARMVGHAMQQLSLQHNSLLFIESIGNLMCPSSFDLGEAHKVVSFPSPKAAAAP